MSTWKEYRFSELLVDESISYGIVQPGAHTEIDSVPIIRVKNIKNGNISTNDVLKVACSIVSSVNYFSPLATIIFPHCLWSMRGGMGSERREPVGRPEFTPHPASGSICSFCFSPFAPENLHKPISVCQPKIDHPGESVKFKMTRGLS